MDHKKTADLLEQLKISNKSYESYLEENEDSFIQNDLSEYWQNLLNNCPMKKTDIINKADVGYTFFYDIIKGKKIPSRDTICKIHISMNRGLEVCQTTLKIYNWASLYPKNKRDSIIIYGLTHGLALYEVDAMLRQNEQLPLAKTL